MTPSGLRGYYNRNFVPKSCVTKKKKKKFDFDNTDTEHKIFEGNNMGLGILALFLPSN